MLNGVVREEKLPGNPVLKLKIYKEPKSKTRFLWMEEEQILLDKLGFYGSWAREAMLTGL